MASVMNNNIKAAFIDALLNGATVKMILMATGFSYDIDADDGYADVSASELANGNGYTTGGVMMSGYAVAIDDVNDRADATWSNITWTASGGSIGPSPGAIPYIDSHVSDLCIGYIDFGTDQTATDGGTFAINNPTVRIS